MVISLIAALLLGLALTAVGIRGVRTDDHPLCRRCRFDLTGRAADSTRCPECGADLGRPGAVVVGHREHRRGVLAAGLSLTVPATLLAGLVGWATATGANVLGHAPVGYLLWQASSGVPARGAPAVDELAARLADGRLGGAAWDRVADAGLAFQGDPSKAWDPAWGDLLEVAHASGHLTAAQWGRYVTQATAGMFPAVELRAKVGRGDPVPFRVVFRPGHVGRHSGLMVGLRRMRLSWDDAPAVDLSQSDGGTHSMAAAGGSCGYTGTATDLPAGDHTAHVSADLTVGSYGPGGLVGFPAGTMTLAGPVALLPSGQSSVRMVHDPAAADALRRAIRISLTRGTTGPTTFHVAMDAAPVGLGFDVLVRSAGREAKLATFATPAFTGSHDWYNCLSGPSALTDAARVDVVLRPSAAAAAATADTYEAWDGELVYPDVPVK